MSNTKENIILAFLKLNCEKGKASIGDIANEVGIQKSSIYSHFKDYSDLENQALNYGYEALSSRKLDVNLKVQTPLALLTNLTDNIAKTFSTEPVSWYFNILIQNRLSNPLYESHYKKADLILMARIQVALEFCVQENWLNISNTDYAAMFLASVIKEKLPFCNSDWEFEEIPNRFTTLFAK